MGMNNKMHESQNQGKTGTVVYEARGPCPRVQASLDSSKQNRECENDAYRWDGVENSQSPTQQGGTSLDTRRYRYLTYPHILQGVKDRLQYSVCVGQGILCQLFSGVKNYLIEHTRSQYIPYLLSYFKGFLHKKRVKDTRTRKRYGNTRVEPCALPLINYKAGHQPTFGDVTDAPCNTAKVLT